MGIVTKYIPNRVQLIYTALLCGLLLPLTNGAMLYAAPIAPTIIGYSGAGQPRSCSTVTNERSVTVRWTNGGAASYNYRITSPSGTTSDPIATSAASGPVTLGDDGSNLVEVQAVDNSGQVSEWSAPCEITLDTTNPVIALSPQSGAYIRGTSTVTATFTEAHPASYSLAVKDSSNVVVNIDGTKQEISATPPTSNTLSLTLDATKLPDGLYSSEATAIDTLGNTTTETATFTVDNTVPSITVDGFGNPVSSARPVIRGSVSEFPSTIAVTIGGKTYAATSSDGTWSISPEPLGDGTYDIQAIATDAAGNQSAAATSIVTIDTTSPTAIITSPVSGDILNGTVTISGSVGGAISYQLIINDVVVQTGTNGPINYLWNTASLPSGSYTISLKAVDAAGNSSIDSTVVTIDTTPPNIPLNTSPTNGAQGNSSAISSVLWNMSEDLNGPVTYAVQFSTNSIFSTVLISRSTSGLSLPIPALSDGTYFWRVQACDRLGNCSDWSPVFRFLLDNTPPIVTFNDADTTDRTPTVSGTVNDKDAIVTIKISGITYRAIVSKTTNQDGTYDWTAFITALLSIRSHSVTVYVRDIHGNDSILTEALTVTLPSDTTGDSDTTSSAVRQTTSGVTAGVTNNKNMTDENGNSTRPLVPWPAWLLLIAALAAGWFVYYRTKKTAH